MVYDESWLRDFPYWSLDDAHATVDDNFPHEWASFWGIGKDVAPEDVHPDKWEEANRLHRIARRLVHAAGELSGSGLPEDTRELPKKLRAEAAEDWERRQQYLEALREKLQERDSDELKALQAALRHEWPSEASEKLFSTAVQIHAWKRFGSSPHSVASRTLELLDYLVRARGERTKAYLSRVAKCYIRGMDTELAVMARAVLEAALEAAPLEDAVDQVMRNSRGKRFVPLDGLIEAASLAGAFDEDARLAAHAIREAGNSAVHKAPGLEPPGEDVLRDLKVALESIEEFATQ